VIISSTAVSFGKEDQTFTIYWENDGTFLKPDFRTDRHYTNGLKMAYTHQPEWKWLKDFGRWNGFADNDVNVRTAMGYFFGHNIYTPDDIANPREREQKDRKFAGWFYTGLFAQRATENKLEHFELNLGVIGPSARADEIQRFVHTLIHVGLPSGWDDQINDEAAADFTWWTRRHADALTFKHTSEYDSHIEYGFTAGTVHRNATMSILFRYGINLPNDFGPGRLESPDCAAGRIDTEGKNFYVFARLGGRLVQFDRFLTGLDTNPAVGLIQAGLVGQYKSFQISYSQTFLTQEYKEQPSGDSYASLNLTYRF
jgi:hypothetical protein